MGVLRRSYFLYLILSVMAIATAGNIAYRTAVGVHPDERFHIDAFRYFGDNWWPPDLNSDDVLYCATGWSRVYAGEVVYIVYGKLGALISGIDWFVRETVTSLTRHVYSEPTTQHGFNLPLITDDVGWWVYKARLYRLLNVLLYLITLVITFSLGKKHSWINTIGLILICLPQVTYVYSYANSDAWGLSFGLFLFYVAVTYPDLLSMSIHRALALGALTGLLLLSKQSFWMSLFFSYAPIAYHAAIALYQQRMSAFRALTVRAMLVLGIALIVVLPLLVVYPLMQGDFAAGKEQMLEARSVDWRKPSNPQDGYRLAAQGVPLLQVIRDPQWWVLSLKSLYGVFGYMNVYLPGYLYKGVATVIGGLIAVSLGFTLAHWKALPTLSKVLWVSIPPTLLLTFAASFYYSWVIDWQPQGRYLFVVLLPTAILLEGAPNLGPRWLRTSRIVVCGFLFFLSLYVLWTMMLTNPQLSAATLRIF